MVCFFSDHSQTLTTDNENNGDAFALPAQDWVTQVPRDEVLDAFSDCGSDVQALLSFIVDSCSRWAIHTIDPPLDNFVKGNVALVGDAAHGMCPHLGAAVGQGFEDAIVLCRLLLHPDTTNTSDIQVGVSRSLQPPSLPIPCHVSMGTERFTHI